MDLVIRAVDVGFGNTKYIRSVIGGEIRCSNFPSIAYPSMRDPASLPGFERRKTVAIPINGLFYEVGPDIALAADAFRATQMHDRYIETPEYMALLRGALSMMKVATIDLLVVGLPVAMLVTKKMALEKAVTGTHDVGGGKNVVVKKALAVAQPQGALVDFAWQHQKSATIEREQSLIIDPGSRTFDWLVARGMRLVQNKSHSVNRGVADMLHAIAAEISADIGTPYGDLDAIDVALRTSKNPVIFQKPYDISRAMPMAHAIAQQAVASMMRWVEASYSVQNIILVGGGAYLFKKAVKEAFPKHRVLEVKDSLHANVRGFQIAGMSHAPKLLEHPDGTLPVPDRVASTTQPGEYP
ncbi:MAG: PRTRC system protein D [Pseudomonadota bacterium]